MSIARPPIYTYISPGLLTTMRREMSRFLLHTYTRTPRLSVGTIDSWGQPLMVAGTPVTDVPCFFEIRERFIIQPGGGMVVSEPILKVAFDDPLKEGDVISNVRTLADPTTGLTTLILSGPVSTETVVAKDSNMGGPLFIEATLHEITEVVN